MRSIIVRLATSAVLAESTACIRTRQICDSILKGYHDGIAAENRSPFVLDRDDQVPDRDTQMRDLLSSTTPSGEKFWKKFDAAKRIEMEEYEKGGERPKVRPARQHAGAGTRRRSIARGQTPHVDLPVMRAPPAPAVSAGRALSASANGRAT